MNPETVKTSREKLQELDKLLCNPQVHEWLASLEQKDIDRPGARMPLTAWQKAYGDWKSDTLNEAQEIINDENGIHIVDRETGESLLNICEGQDCRTNAPGSPVIAGTPVPQHEYVKGLPGNVKETMDAWMKEKGVEPDKEGDYPLSAVDKFYRVVYKKDIFEELELEDLEDDEDDEEIWEDDDEDE